MEHVPNYRTHSLSRQATCYMAPRSLPKRKTPVWSGRIRFYRLLLLMVSIAGHYSLAGSFTEAERSLSMGRNASNADLYKEKSFH